MRKLISITAALAALGAIAIPAVASADKPVDGVWTINEASPAGQELISGIGGPTDDITTGGFNGSAMGEYNSRVKQQGWFVSAQAHDLGGRHVALGQSK